MKWQALLDALALVFIIEGLLPFVSPDKYKQTLLRVIQASAQQIRIYAMIAIALGLLILVLF